MLDATVPPASNSSCFQLHPRPASFRLSAQTRNVFRPPAIAIPGSCGRNQEASMSRPAWKGILSGCLPLLLTAGLMLVQPGELRAGVWVSTGSGGGSANGTATLLPNGKVLAVGGVSATSALYDPEKWTWSKTGSLVTARISHTATLLPNGKVLVLGGYNDRDSYLASAELYDPASGTWSAAGSLATARRNHTAVLLPDGKVLVAGGDSRSGRLASAELYDPATGTSSATGFLAKPRDGHTATLLPDGKVLVAGGYCNAPR
jgi:WD40 repeat protein